MLSARGGDFFNDVAATVAPGAILHGVFGVFRWPQAEAVVMFAGEDQAFHSCSGCGAYDLVGVEMRWVEE
jgi:hypothetical protein